MCREAGVSLLGLMDQWRLVVFCLGGGKQPPTLRYIKAPHPLLAVWPSVHLPHLGGRQWAAADIKEGQGLGSGGHQGAAGIKASADIRLRRAWGSGSCLLLLTSAVRLLLSS